MQPRILWNQAATTAPPLEAVATAMIEGLGVPGHGRSSEGGSTTERLRRIRLAAAKRFGFGDPERVIFVPACTYGLNFAVHGAIRSRECVLTTELEHNSLSRPLEAARRRGVHVEVLPADAQGRMNLSCLERRLQQGGVDWLAFAIASNVLGTLEPFEEACALARSHGVRTILDLAQGGGMVPLSLDALGCAYAAVSGHKSLHGPRGIGLLFVGPHEDPEPHIQGGTGSEGSLLAMPAQYPQRLEAGTSNLPGIFGLGAALDAAADSFPDLQPIRNRLSALETWCRARADLQVLPPEPPPWSQRLPVLALHARSVPAELLAAHLGARGIDARSGNMCTSRLLPALGLTAGVLRLSPPLEASDADFEAVRAALEEGLTLLA